MTDTDLATIEGEPNYAIATPPEEKPKTEYNYKERRADLYDRLMEVGYHGDLPSTREIAPEYGVSHATIANDLKKIKTWIAAQFGNDIKHELETMKDKAVSHYLENDQPQKAYYLLKNHAELLIEAGILEGKTEEHEHKHEFVMAEAWREATGGDDYQNPLYESDDDVIDVEAVTADRERDRDRDD